MSCAQDIFFTVRPKKKDIFYSSNAWGRAMSFTIDHLIDRDGCLIKKNLGAIIKIK